MNEAQKNRMIKYLLYNRLISEDDSQYRLTEKGEELLEILKKRELVGLLARELGGDRIRRW